MCGIFGIVGDGWREHAERALDTLTCRGPDDQGWYHGQRVVLGHRRLSIIDLATGHQPMTTPDGRYSIVFNGEIYNYRELRDDLHRLGVSFATQSDTEVLLHGYAAWGAELAGRLDGIFAFAIWDATAKRLFAARDRMGIKPFMYSTHRGFVFGSTLEPFFALEGFPRRIDFEALRDYLAFQTPLAPHTMLAAVKQLLPAHWLEYAADSGRLAFHQYWQIPHADAKRVGQDELIARVDLAVAQSVKRQLVADVPIGAFLSGGIDSSLMVHYMAQAGAQPLRTFSVRFAEAALDESGVAAEVASLYGTRHEIFDAPDLDPHLFEQAIAGLDQPLADPAYVPTFALSRLARAHVKVAISGDGGDEVFGGYRRFLEQEMDFPRRPWQPALRRLVALGLLPGALLRRTLSGRELLLYRKVELGPYPVSRKSMQRFLSPDARQAARLDATLERWLALADLFSPRLDTDTLMRADLWTYLSENCLVKTDRASMAVGLEVRVPLLGNPVLDEVLRHPASVHFGFEGGDHVSKVLLRALAKQHLPRTVWDRPKHGFSVPIARYMRTQWRDRCQAWLADARTMAPFIDHAAVRELWRRFQAGRGSARLAYTFVVLFAWLSRHRLEA